MSALGLVLLVMGAALVVAEAHVPTHGVLGTGAAAALVAGVVLLVTAAGASAAVTVPLAGATALAGAGAVWLLAGSALRAQRTPVRSGVQRLVGALGEVRCAPEPIGQVFVDGALWRARVGVTEDEDPVPLAPGDPVVVERVNGLTLTVRRAEDWETLE